MCSSRFWYWQGQGQCKCNCKWTWRCCHRQHQICMPTSRTTNSWDSLRENVGKCNVGQSQRWQNLRIFVAMLHLQVSLDQHFYTILVLVLLQVWDIYEEMCRLLIGFHSVKICQDVWQNECWMFAGDMMLRQFCNSCDLFFSSFSMKCEQSAKGIPVWDHGPNYINIIGPKFNDQSPVQEYRCEKCTRPPCKHFL